MRAIGVSHTACKDEFRRNLRSHSWSVFSFFIINISRTSAVSSTNLGSILIFASCVVGTVLVIYYLYVGEFFLNVRGPIILFYVIFHHYNGWCWYFYSINR